MASIMLQYDPKTKTLTREGSSWSQRLGTTGKVKFEVPVTLDDHVPKGMVGFDALHAKLHMLAGLHKFDANKVIQYIATTSIIRRIHLIQQCLLPQYIAVQILLLLNEYGAGVGGGAMRKTEEYAAFLRSVLAPIKTVTSYMANQRDAKYVLPTDIEEMFVEQILEEIRVAKEGSVTPAIMTKLNNYLHARQQADRAEKLKGKPKSDMDTIRHVIAEDAAYDDVPTTTKKKRKEEKRER